MMIVRMTRDSGEEPDTTGAVCLTASGIEPRRWDYSVTQDSTWGEIHEYSSHFIARQTVSVIP